MPVANTKSLSEHGVHLARSSCSVKFQPTATIPPAYPTGGNEHEIGFKVEVIQRQAPARRFNEPTPGNPGPGFDEQFRRASPRQSAVRQAR